jgi:hypothetical protein
MPVNCAVVWMFSLIVNKIPAVIWIPEADEEHEGNGEEKTVRGEKPYSAVLYCCQVCTLKMNGAYFHSIARLFQYH